MHTPGLLACLVVASLPVVPMRAEATKPEKPIPINTVKADKSPLSGRLVAYDDDGFDLARGNSQPVRIRWDELGPPGIFNVRSTVLGPRATAVEWLELGRTMLDVKGGEPFAERAFAKAVKLNPRLKDDVEQIKQAAAERPEKPAQNAAAAKGAAAPSGPGGDAADKASASVAAGGPQMVGKSDGKAWPPLTDAQRTAAVGELKKFADETNKRLKKDLKLYETKYFLFYSDLAVTDAYNWASLLDRMYGRLADLFGVQKDARGEYANIWYGKALVFVFQKAEDYRRFQVVCHQTDPGPSAGMCHCYADGTVHIAFYRQNEELTFAHVLVHESVHGFIHRFRSPAVVPSWANEGLAEVIAAELVPQPGRDKQRLALARQGLQTYGGTGGLFEAKHITGWQYPVAETLCAFMIRQSKTNYVNFVSGMKDGLTWQQSLEQRYKAPRDRLLQAYGASVNVKTLAQ